eukprot:3463067-Ditylum_brightwellii.AAC.1
MACSHQHNPLILCLQRCRGKAQSTGSQCQWTITTGTTLGHKEELMASDFHTWGCPIFVLDCRSQSSTGIGSPKGDPKIRASIYLGHSPCHADNAALVLNLQTGH